MRVLIYWHCFFLPETKYLIEALAKQPLISELILVGPKAHSTDELPPKCYRVPSLPFRPKWCGLRTFYSLIKKEKPDRILIIDEPLSWNVLAAGLAAKLSHSRSQVFFYAFENLYHGIPWNLIYKRPLVFLMKAFRFFCFDRLLLPIRKKCITAGLVSSVECQEVLLKYKWDLKTQKHPWPIDLKVFQKEAPLTEIAARREGLRILDHIKVIGYVGRFVPEKGIFDLLQAFLHFEEDTHLLFIGEGPLRAKMEAFIEENKLSKKISLIGQVDSQELTVWYQVMDVLVLPSRTQFFWKEQYGRVLIEAMAAKCRVVGSDSGAIPSIIGNARFIFKEGNSQDMAAKIQEALHSLEEENITQYFSKIAAQANIKSFVQALLTL